MFDWLRNAAGVVLRSLPGIGQVVRSYDQVNNTRRQVNQRIQQSPQLQARVPRQVQRVIQQPIPRLNIRDLQRALNQPSPIKTPKVARDIDQFTGSFNERYLGGLGRGAVRTAEWLIPGNQEQTANSINNRLFPEAGSKAARTSLASRADKNSLGGKLGTGAKAATDIASIVIPGTAAQKGVQGLQAVSKLAQGGRVARFAAAAIPEVASGIPGSFINVLQERGRGNKNNNLAGELATGAAIDALTPTGLKLLGKGYRALRTSLGVSNPSVVKESAQLGANAIKKLDDRIEVPNFAEKGRLQAQGYTNVKVAKNAAPVGQAQMGQFADNVNPRDKGKFTANELPSRISHVTKAENAAKILQSGALKQSKAPLKGVEGAKGVSFAGAKDAKFFSWGGKDNVRFEYKTSDVKRLGKFKVGKQGTFPEGSLPADVPNKYIRAAYAGTPETAAKLKAAGVKNVYIDPELNLKGGKAVANNYDGPMPKKDPLEALKAEARKYKSAEEFISKRQTAEDVNLPANRTVRLFNEAGVPVKSGDEVITLYHGTNAKGMKGINETGTINPGSFFATDKTASNRFAFGKDGGVMELKVRAKDVPMVQRSMANAGGASTQNVAKLVKGKDGVWKAEELPTRQQLTDLYNQATAPKKDPLEALKAEARKYKSAEEFVRTQGEPLYHGSNISNIDMIEKNFRTLSEAEHNKLPTTVVGGYQPGLSATSDKTMAEYFASLQPYGKDGVVQLHPVKQLRVYELPKNVDSIDQLGSKKVLELKAEGYDVIHDVRNTGGEAETRILNPEAFKTKQQLTDLYNQATKGAKAADPLEALKAERDTLAKQIKGLNGTPEQYARYRELKDAIKLGENPPRAVANPGKLDSLNPTGGVYVDYTPQKRATMPLADNIKTLAHTTKQSPDTMITIYRGAPKSQKSIVPGDFIITDTPGMSGFEAAKYYSGDGNVISKRVRLGDILDDVNDPQGGEYLYRPGAFKEVNQATKQSDSMYGPGQYGDDIPESYLKPKNEGDKALKSMINETADALDDFRKQTGGVTRVPGQDGGEIRQSMNPKWYQDFYASNGRAPSKKEIREIAYDMLERGDKELETIGIDTELYRATKEMAAEAPKLRTQAPQTAKIVDPNLQTSNFDATLKSRGYDIGDLPGYKRLPNDEVMARAESEVATNEASVMKRLLARNPKQAPTPQENAEAITLLRNLTRQGRTEDALAVAKVTASSSREAGRAVQILSKLEATTPEGAVVRAQKVIQEYNDKISKEAKKLTLTEANFTEIQKLANEVQATALNSRARDVAEGKLLKYIEDLVPSSALKKLSSLQTMAQLLNPKTAIRNILGNAVATVGEDLSTIPATVADSIVSMLRGTARTTTVANPIIKARGAAKGLKYGIEDVSLGIKTSGITGKFDVQPNVFKKGILQKLEKALGYELGAADKAFYQAQFDSSLDSLMRAKKTKDVTPDLVEIANAEALYSTFQNNSKLAGALQKTKSVLNMGKEWGMGDIVLKYPKTPGNIVSVGLDYSPVGVAKGLTTLYKNWDTLPPSAQREAVRNIGRGITGTGVIGVGALLAANGIITGRPNSDPDMSKLERESGQGPFSFNMSALGRFLRGEDPKIQRGDVVANYDWMQPTAIALSMGANMVLNKTDAEKSINDAWESLASGIDTVTDQPVLKGVGDFAKTSFTSRDRGGGVDRAIANAVVGAPASFVPSAVNQTSQLFDNTPRETRNSNLGKQAVDNIWAKIPGARNNLPAQYTSLGEQRQMYDNNSNNLFNVFLNPAFVKTYKDSEVVNLVRDINARSGETQQVPRAADRSVNINGEQKKLTPAEFSQYQQYIGSKTNEQFGILAKDPKFMALSDEDKAKRMSNIMSDINTAAKMQLFGDNPKKTNKNAARIINNKSIATVSDTPTNPKEAYEVALEKYKQDKQDGTISEIGDITRQKSLKKLEVASKYDQDTVDLYGLSGKQLDAYLRTKQNGGALWRKVVEYDQALYEAGTITKPKFRDSKGNLYVPGTRAKGKKAKLAKVQKARAPRKLSIKKIKGSKSPRTAKRSVPVLRAKRNTRRKVTFSA